jgi:hypothetical protein
VVGVDVAHGKQLDPVRAAGEPTDPALEFRDEGGDGLARASVDDDVPGILWRRAIREPEAVAPLSWQQFDGERQILQSASP